MKTKESIRKGEQLHLVHKRHSIILSKVFRGFLTLPEKEDQVALVILARLFAALKILESEDQLWWLVETAKYELRGLVGMASEEWKRAAEWPLAALNMGREESILGIP